jgi:hypothetical protein
MRFAPGVFPTLKERIEAEKREKDRGLVVLGLGGQALIREDMEVSTADVLCFLTASFLCLILFFALLLFSFPPL